MSLALQDVALNLKIVISNQIINKTNNCQIITVVLYDYVFLIIKCM